MLKSQHKVTKLNIEKDLSWTFLDVEIRLTEEENDKSVHLQKAYQHWITLNYKANCPKTRCYCVFYIVLETYALKVNYICKN